MPRLKRLSGAEVIQILGEFAFQVHSQKGSQVKLRRSDVDNYVYSWINKPNYFI